MVASVDDQGKDTDAQFENDPEMLSLDDRIVGTHLNQVLI